MTHKGEWNIHEILNWEIKAKCHYQEQSRSFLYMILWAQHVNAALMEKAQRAKVRVSKTQRLSRTNWVSLLSSLSKRDSQPAAYRNGTPKSHWSQINNNMVKDYTKYTWNLRANVQLPMDLKKSKARVDFFTRSSGTWKKSGYTSFALTKSHFPHGKNLPLQNKRTSCNYCDYLSHCMRICPVHF